MLKEQQHANHHAAYTGPEGIDLELHTMLAEPFDDECLNQRMMSLLPEYFSKKTYVECMGVSLPVASDALQALELLLHMLQHFLRAGFGLKLLTDWVVFWNKDREAAVYREFLEKTGICGIEGFAEAITFVCETYLGLKKNSIFDGELSKKFSEGYAERFLKEIISAEEFGKADPNRMVALRKRSLIGYLKEFHYQMKLSYPQQSKKKILWPYLWIKTFAVFMRNNRQLGRGKLKNILKSAGDRAVIVEEMKLFEK